MQRAFPDAVVAGLDLDVVTLDEIASRCDLSAEAVRRHFEQGPQAGGLPRPFGFLRGGQPLWPWADVHMWLTRHGHHVEAGQPIPVASATEFQHALVCHNRHRAVQRSLER